MSDHEQNAPPVSAIRRRLLQGMAALPAAAMLPRPGYAAAPPTSAVNTTGLAGYR